MKPAPFLTARNVLLFSLAAEAVTALAVIVAPGLVAQLLLHADISGAAIVLLLLKPALRGRAAPVD